MRKLHPVRPEDIKQVSLGSRLAIYVVIIMVSISGLAVFLVIALIFKAGNDCTKKDEVSAQRAIVLEQQLQATSLDGQAVTDTSHTTNGDCLTSPGSYAYAGLSKSFNSVTDAHRAFTTATKYTSDGTANFMQSFDYSGPTPLKVKGLEASFKKGDIQYTARYIFATLLDCDSTCGPEQFKSLSDSPLARQPVVSVEIEAFDSYYE